MTGRLILSAAHTLMTPGFVFGDLREVDLTRKIVNKMSVHLAKTKIEYKLVPLDLLIGKRIEWINDTGYSAKTDDIFIEIHIAEGGKRGLKGWYSGKKEDKFNRSKVFGDELLKIISEKTKYTNNGASSEFEHPKLQSILILNQTNPVGLMLELLCIDNQDDIAILKDEAKLDDLARLTVESIKNFLESDKSKPIPGAPSAGSPDDDMDDDEFEKELNDIFVAPPPLPKPTSTPVVALDRNQREQMVKDIYKKILGRDPNMADLNHHINIGSSEEMVIKKLLESPDHSKIIADAKSLPETTKKLETAENDLLGTKAELDDLKRNMENLNKLLSYKNFQIKQTLQVLLNNGIIVQGEYFDYTNPEKYSLNK